MISRRILAAAAALLYLLAAPSHAVAQVQQVFSTLATATAATIPASIDTVTTLGRNAAGDYGGASYIRIGASTAAAWRFQSADGQWWAINNRIVTPEMFGCFSSTDCTSAFLSLSSWLQTASSGGITNGGIIVNFKPGADYKIWPSGTTPNGGGALQLYSVNGVTFNYNGARISTDNDWTTHDGIVVRVINGSNLIFNDPSYACTSCSGSIDFSKYGIQFYIAEASAPWSNNIQINNATQFWGSAFLEVSGDVNSATPGATQDQAHNISVINADLQHVFYGLNFQAAGDNFFARGVKCTDCARIYFPWNVSNHDVELIKNGGGSGFVSVMLKAYALPGGSDIKRSLSNIRVKYRDSGETAATAVVVGLDMQQTVAQPNVSGAAGNGSGLLRLTVDTTANMATGQTWFVNSVGGITNVNGASYVVTVIDGTHVDLQGSGGFGGSYTSGGYMRVPAALRDISIQVENTLAANQPPAFVTYKENADGSADTTTDGYTVENITFSGALKNYNYGVPAINLFSGTGGSLGTWVGETIRNISLRDLTITGTSSSAIIDATNIQANLTLENIVSPATVPWVLTDPNSRAKRFNVSATGLSDGATVTPGSAPAHQFANGVAVSGAISYAQPSLSDLSGWGAGALSAAGNTVNASGGLVTFNGALGAASGSSLTLTGNLVNLGLGAVFGPGGTGTANAAIVINGGSASGGGGGLLFMRNSATTFTLGNSSALTGGTQNDIALYNWGLAAYSMKVAAADSSVIFGSTTASTSSATGSVTAAGGIGAAGAIYGGAEVVTGSVAVGSLPACNAARKAARHFVTDANATFTAGVGAVVAGGGANNVPVTCDGTNWRIGANDHIPAHLVRKFA